ncbi:MAG: 2Fe-2S iron-sulfur cluster-binding protein [Pseudomonadota bacterium]
MPQIMFISYDGREQAVEAPVGESVMQAAVDNSIDGITAECGGACSCATCHCFVDEAWLDKFPPPDPIEEQMIEYSIDPQSNSRLSCQLEVTEDMDGLVIRLPERQF